MIPGIGFRYVLLEDRNTIQEWIACDPDHRERGMSADFFYEPGFMSLCLFDDEGPGLFVRVDPDPPETARIHIQYSPGEVRSAKTMLRGWPEFSERVWGCGVSRMVFESRSPKLINFCHRVFGFERVGSSNDFELYKESPVEA